MIQVEAESAGLIGDALCHVPYLDWLAKAYKSHVVINHMNSHVAAMLDGYPITFANLDPARPVKRLRLITAFLRKHECHMAQAFFKLAGQEMPELPLTLRLKSQPCNLEPGLVLSPYSRSDISLNKIWPHERWVETVQTLRGEGRISRAYVVGAAAYDGADQYAAAGIEPVLDRPLSQVLHLIRQAPLLLSIDNGISHLAHFGGIDRHVLLYPGCLPICWARNPRAEIVTAGRPVEVPVVQVLQAARKMMDR